MHGPALSGWLLVALCSVTGGYRLARMRRCSGGARGEAGGEALMGLGMAVMAVPAAVWAPPGWTRGVYGAVFGGAALAALWSARRGPAHHLHHLVGSLAMVYMAYAMPHGQGHAGHTAAGAPLLTGALLAYYAVYVLRTGTRLVPATATAAGPAGAKAARTGPARATAAGTGAPAAAGADAGLAVACRSAMGLAMLAMLLPL